MSKLGKASITLSLVSILSSLLISHYPTRPEMFVSWWTLAIVWTICGSLVLWLVWKEFE
jgi:low affinity Fe/Cu permease